MVRAHPKRVNAGALRGTQRTYLLAMVTLVGILLVISMLGVVGVLFAGMLGLVRGPSDPQRSNALMRWRVILQGVALALFALFLAIR